MKIEDIIDFIKEHGASTMGFRDREINEWLDCLNKYKDFIEKLDRIKYRSLNKQNELDELLQKTKERNKEEIWLSLDLLIEEYK